MSYEIESSMYPSWCKENEMSIDDVEIYSIFKYLGSTFGFQLDNVKNMFDFFMCQLDSRSSRMLCPNALLSIHADYIGGENSNYKKWFFATQFHFNGSKKVEMSNSSEEILDIDTIKKAEFYWKSRLVVLTHKDYVTQISLYLLIWGESNNIRFLPECICFIYFCAYNCLMSQPCLTCTEYSFLDNFITPIYTFLSVQLRRIESEKDHSQIIGYDDINQFFWNASAINKIKLYDGTKFKNISSPIDKWLKFSEINWEKTFKKFGKSYKERRTWLHLIVNFNRIWIIHITMYWYYTSLNSPTLYTIGYVQMLDNQPPAQVRWTIASLGGAIACALQIFATICEITLFGSTRDKGCKTFLTLVFLMILLGVNIAPSIYLLGFIPLSVFSKSGLYISIGQFIFSVLTFLYLAIIPSNSLFCIKDNVYSRQVFTRSFPLLSKSRKLYSILFWVSIFSAKFIESYFFLILSLKDPIRVLSIMEMKRCNENNILWGNLLCRQQARIILALMYLADLVLFFLDTYLWYIICNCIFSMSLSFSSGVSIFAPWKNIFTRLPERISTKLVSKGGSNLLDDINIRISDIWNSIVLSMYREHILSIDQVTKLVYEKIENTNVIRAPIFFIYQDDNNNSMRIAEFFNPGGESGRRISFFAQSISASIPEPIPTVSMPTFTVLVPHYSEKIILTLKEIIKEDTNSKMSLLEYLKAMKPLDWENFVKDTKILSSVEENVSSMEGSTIFVEDGIETFKPEEEFVKSNIDDLPLYCMGFKNSSPEYLLRTRIWASLRSQTLYRTISGFMNYQKAIQLLHYSETASDYYKNDGEEMDTYHQLLNRKFKLIVAMQRFQEFNDEEREDAKLLFSTYPDLLVSYIEKKEIDNKVSYYSCLLELDEFGEFTVKYRIKLSGNPILGDGKLDNQNHSIIFYRGEYIQVIDSNQDNYLEECLKIKSVLSEFEELNVDSLLSAQYIPGFEFGPNVTTRKIPVAIVGAREYIFSENFGILGDIAASKEQTFGTLFARTLADIGGKLHYGHPDFMNGIFMTTRGGISKGQRGLHLNEDIYAGMTAISRGGRIKHCDYYQCGKGRDMGFHSILNFTTKIGAGMGEQILSREHYNLGTQLSIDRFLSFFYAHPGFHLNNLFIMLSVELIMLILVNLGSLVHESIMCNEIKQGGKYTDLEQPLGCYNLLPVLKWVNRYVLSVIICFFLSFMPLFLQDFIEKGPKKAILRILCHFASISPIFEVFVCQVYSKSLRDNLTFGGAKYIATGRNLAISRNSFAALYSKYANITIYSGSTIFLKLLFATLTIWQASLLWFWIAVVSLSIAPFLFNPHQFSWNEFFIDYRDFLRWLNRGNSKSHNNSWVEFTRSQRSRLTGYKKPKKGNQKRKLVNRASRWNVFVDQFLVPSLQTFFMIIPFLFINSQNGVKTPKNLQVMIRISIVTIFPLILNALVILVFFFVSTVFGPILTHTCCKKSTGVLAASAHAMLIVVTVLTLITFFILQGGNFIRTLSGILCVLSLKRIIISFILTLLSRELNSGITNRVWWSGNWWICGGREREREEDKLGFWLTLSQILREFFVKVIEMELFSYDFILTHVLLLLIAPFLFFPYIDKIHSMMLFWSRQPFPKKLYLKRVQSQRKKSVWIYCIIFFIIQLIFAAVIVFLVLISINFKNVEIILYQKLPILRNPIINQLIQPNFQNNNDTGPMAPKYILSVPPKPVPMKTIS